MASGALPFVGYVRVSFVGRRKGDRFHSPDEQVAAIRGWAAAHQVEVNVLPAELNAKGSDRDRPILNDAIDGIEHGRYAGLVVAYLSRVARSAKHTLEIYERVEAAVDVRSGLGRSMVARTGSSGAVHVAHSVSRSFSWGCSGGACQ